jgi:hypothetical protein
MAKHPVVSAHDTYPCSRACKPKTVDPPHAEAITDSGIQADACANNTRIGQWNELNRRHPSMPIEVESGMALVILQTVVRLVPTCK